MKYTKSMDGVERCTVNLEMRLTKEEYKEILELAKKLKKKSVKEYLESRMLDGEVMYNNIEQDKHNLKYDEAAKGETDGNM